MADVARKHHYLPQFYLAAFTNTGTKDGSLTVFDNLERRTWHTKPREVAHQRDFYRVDLPGVEPDALEKTFADLESQAAEVLCQIHLKKQLPEGDDDFNTWLNFGSLMMVRVPALRDVHRQNMEQYYDMLMRMASHSREAWQKTLKGIKADSYNISSKVT